MNRRALLVTFFFLGVAIALVPDVFASAEGISASQEATLEEILISDIGLIIVAAAVGAAIAYVLKQPMIPAYILAGIVIGPIGSKYILGGSMIYDPEIIIGLSQLGITFLLFTVGMELDLSRLKGVGFYAATIGLAQIAITFLVGMGAANLLGFSGIEAIYLGLIVSFSSTMVVIKILADRSEIETLHGRIMLGILLIQDVVVIIVLSVISNPNDLSVIPVLDAVVKSVGLFCLALVLSKYISPRIFKYVSKSVELLFLTALSFCFIFAFVSFGLGFSPAIGGFLAGLSLAVFPYNLEVSSRIKPLRDFFAVMFFVSLGMQTVVQDLGQVVSLIVPLIVFLLIAIAIKPIVITFLCMLMGYGKRTSFLSSLGLAQISEFSLILAMPLGFVSPVFLIAVIVAIVTISLTSYFVDFGNKIYVPFSGVLKIFDKISIIKQKQDLENVPKKSMTEHAVLFGAHITGQEILDKIQEMDKEVIVVDNNPEIIKKLIRNNVNCIYGDVEDLEILEKLNLEKVRLVVSTVPSEEDSMMLLDEVKKRNPEAVIFVTARTIEDAINLYREGADYVINPKILAGREASRQIENDLRGGRRKLLKHKIKDINYLEKKKRDELIDRLDPKLLDEIDELRNECGKGGDLIRSAELEKKEKVRKTKKTVKKTKGVKRKSNSKRKK